MALTVFDSYESKQIKQTKDFVKSQLQDAEGGHDWFHTERVYKNSMLLAKYEDVNMFVVALGALLHDIADSKFHNGDEKRGPQVAREFLFSIDVDSSVIEEVVRIIENISYSKSLELSNKDFRSNELLVVQDADRLDALGAIGIARCFNYGGFKNRKIYDPSVRPNLQMTKEEYKMSQAPTINHFYEKLLLLKNQMNTETGKKIALERHNYMVSFLKQFYGEWEGLQ